MRTWVPTAGLEPTDRWPKPSKHSVADRPGARVSELARHWVAAQPIDLEKAISYSRQAGDAALAALAPADALRHYAQALDLYPQLSHPDPALGLDLAIGLGTAQRQTGDPAFRGTLLDASRRAADLNDTERLVAAVLANDRGLVSSGGNIDADKVAVLEMALESPSRRPSAPGPRTRHPVRGTGRRQPARDPPGPGRRSDRHRERVGDDAIMVRVLNHLHLSLRVPSMLEESVVRTADALVRAERVGDPVLLFWAAGWRGEAAICTGDLDENGRCLNLARSAGRGSQPTDVQLVPHVSGAQRSLTTGDTDQAERLANEALQIGIDGGRARRHHHLWIAAHGCRLATRHRGRTHPVFGPDGCGYS